jgi:uncharacterized protein (TIGR03437 family)
MMRTLGQLPVCVAAAWAAVGTAGAQAIINTVAGNGTPGLSGDGGTATSARIGAGLGNSLSVAVDRDGNLLVVDGGNSRVRRVDAGGIIRTIAGGGSATGSGDGGPATNAQVFPNSATADGAGNIYISQGATIRKINNSGIISTIAGNGGIGFSGDGGPATAASFLSTNVAADATGNLYISDSINQRIRKIDTQGIITTFAGNGTQGFSGDGGPATQARLALPQGVAVDTAGNVYFADAGNARVRKVDTNGIISTVAGNGTPLSLGDGGPATSAGMTPVWVAVDAQGNIYIADPGSHRIRKVNTSGIISTYAGGNGAGFAGDGGPAASAKLFNPTSVAVDANGNVYIADTNNYRIRKVSSGASGSPVTATPSTFSFSYTIAGNLPPSQSVVIFTLGTTLTFTSSVSTTDGRNWLSVSPTSGSANNTLSISVSPSSLSPGVYNGTITITPSGAGNSPLAIPVRLSVNSPVSQGVISTVAGNGLIPFSGNGGAATSTPIGPNAVAVDRDGNIYIADIVDSRIFKVSDGGLLSVFAGNGAFTFVGDGGPATSASFFNPSAVAVDSSGNVYIADTQNNRIRKVTTSGQISTVAGNGRQEFSGDGGPATSAGISNPFAVAVDSAGNLYIADAGNNRVRKVNTNGTISTIAGMLLPGFSGDGGPATSASLFLPGGLAVDVAGNVYVADIGNARIRKVSSSGTITTVAGNGSKSFSGDGGQATSAALNMFGSHAGLSIDAVGNLYIPDIANHRVRKVDTAGIITTVAGNGIAGFSGDGGPATAAGLNNPTDVALGPAGNLYISDNTNLRIRKVTFSGENGRDGTPPSISANGVVNGASFQPGAAANSWVTIIGSNLASATDTWANAIVDGKLPTSLDGVSVTIGGRPAYVYYVSPGQINVLAPEVPAGAVPVVVTTSAGASSTFTATVSSYSPAFFAWPGNQAVATRQDFSFAAKAGTFDGATTVPAKPGDVIILWGTGFGPTSPVAPPGVQTPGTQTYSTNTLPVVTINGVNATVFGAALAPAFAGLYQVAIQVPSSVPDGDLPLVASVGGVQSPASMVLTVRR